MDNILNVKNKKLLEALPNHQDGEIAFCEEEDTFMMYKDGAWIPVKAEMTNQGLQLNLYDLNKQLISQLPVLTEDALQEIMEQLNQWAVASTYMLYGRDIHYFTLLQKNDPTSVDYTSFGEGIYDLLKSLTEKIYSIDILSDDSVEIWIEYNDNPISLYLFNYEGGLVYYA